MVIAGPGTGKTQILTLRIANILLQTDTAPESILALTFTESGATAMRERLRRFLGSAAYRVPIHTFHGFAGQLISAYPDAFPRIIGSRPAGDMEKIAIVEAILDNPDIKILRPSGNPSYYITPLLRQFGELKKEYVRPDDFAVLICGQEEQLLSIPKFHEKGAHKGKVRGEYTKLSDTVAKNREVLFVYRQYEAMLRERSLYDFEDMIAEAVTALGSNENMLRDVQELYQYVLADEHQDVNGAQNRILELLASYHASPNIFVVGDEKQAIYRFQGASLQNFLFFQDHFTGTQVIELTENYRSGQVILDAAHSLVTVEDEALMKLRVPLRAAAVAEASLEVRHFSHQAVEDEWLVGAIKDSVVAGTPPEEIAVIVRTNREVEALSGKLRKAGLLVDASADGDILVHPITHAIESLIAAVLTDHDESALFAVLHGAFWGITVNDLVKITSARSYDTSLLSLLADVSKLAALGVTEIDRAYNIHTVIETARAREVTEPPHRVLEYVLQSSGFLDHVMQHDPIEGVRVVRRLYDEVEALVLRDGVGTLAVIRDTFARRRAFNLPLNAPYLSTNQQAVQVMTAHKSKGLEFSVVFMPHLQDSVWGGGAKRSSFNIPLSSRVQTELVDAFDDERRLFYVGMTRAKHALYLSVAATSTDGKVLSPTRFFDDIASNLLTRVDTEAAEAAFHPLTVLTQAGAVVPIDTALITAALKQRGFSATSLNNYLKNPYDYLYRNVLRIPEVQPTHMQFGTAVHNVLEQVTKTHTREARVLSVSEVKALLEFELGRLPLGTTEFTRLLEKGLTVLVRYIEHMVPSLPKATKEEFNIRVLLPTGLPAIPELPLTGKLDRIDLDDRGQALRVVDYKTGKPKSRNQIEGKTASSDGAYKRQLTFYALLLSLYGDERYQCNTGVLSFVESDSKGVIKEESFIITEEEVLALREDIIAAAAMLVSGAFLEDAAVAAESAYAHLITFLARPSA
jgi:DNA helicase II / ATP-dependent DNA helicase PcrA